MIAPRCGRRYCDGRLDFGTDSVGRVTTTCALCERNRRGLCRDCPRALPRPNAMRCLACASARTTARLRERENERYPQRRTAMLIYSRQRRKLPEVREKKRLYMVEYRSAFPRTDVDRAYMREYMATRRADPKYRARQNARRRKNRRMARERAT